MRRFLFCLLLASPAFSQSFSFGLKTGRAVSDPVRNQVRNFGTFTPTSGRSVIGASAELHLPFRVGIEFDILRRPVSYRVEALASERLIEGSFWEFPLLAKYRLRPGLVTPYLAAGLAWNRVSVDDDSELAKSTVAGTPLAGGLEGCFGPFCLSGEIRYTRWHGSNFADAQSEFSNRNQVEVLVGFTF